MLAPEQSQAQLKNSVNGNRAVDLGLSVRWAEYNLGTRAPEESGFFFAWGETKEKKNYNEKSSKSIRKDYKDLSPKQDAATVLWGKDWRMPTDDEIYELIKKCTWELTELNGVEGFKVTGPNGNSIFLPMGGYRIDDELHAVGFMGSYWSSQSPVSSLYNANTLEFNRAKDIQLNSIPRSFGANIRPVTSLRTRIE